jgi:O-succinylbenzoic acid--CoA ligase
VRLEGGRPVADGTALVVATSGSTGTPKGVVLSRRSVDAAVDASLARLDTPDGSAWLSCLPWHHTAGLLTVLRSRARGVEPIVHPAFDVDAVRRDLGGVAWVSLVPTQLRRLLDAGVALSSLDGILLGGAAASAGLLDLAASAGVRVITTYGMTETCGGCAYDGVPLDGVTIGLDANGTILVAGTVVCDGYRDGHTGRVEPLDPITTLDAAGNVAKLATPGGGWLDTEDLGRIEAGRLVVIGRRDDVIITGGENVSAEAIAERLREHRFVQDAAVIGIPDAEWGHRVAAAIVATTELTVDELRTHVRETLGAAAAPREIVFVGEIPRTSLGKTDRAGLVEIL